MSVTKSSVHSGDTITILECPSCGGKHENVQVGTFAKQYGPYTHYFQCPNTGDPSFLSLATYNGSEVAEVSEILCRNLVTAQKTEAWLNATFRVVDGEIFMDRVTHNFPRNDFKKCVQLLEKNLNDENASQTQPAEMAPAAPQTPLMNLFGNSEVVEGTVAGEPETPPSEPETKPSEPVASGEEPDKNDSPSDDVVWSPANTD